MCIFNWNAIKKNKKKKQKKQKKNKLEVAMRHQSTKKTKKITWEAPIRANL